MSEGMASGVPGVVPKSELLSPVENRDATLCQCMTSSQVPCSLASPLTSRRTSQDGLHAMASVGPCSGELGAAGSVGVAAGNVGVAVGSVGVVSGRMSGSKEHAADPFCIKDIIHAAIDRVITDSAPGFS